MINMTGIVKFVLMTLLLNFKIAYAVVIAQDTLVSAPITYTDTVVDLTNGNFIVTPTGSLTIQNSTIIGTITKSNPYLINVDSGALTLDHNTVSINGSSITPHPHVQSLEYLIKIKGGNITITNNKFNINALYTAGLILTDPQSTLQNVTVQGNTIKNFHGVVYLYNVVDFSVTNNRFETTSYGNIVIIDGDQGLIADNTMLFSGVLAEGNGIDIVDSQNVTVSNNLLFNINCYGIVVISSSNIVFSRNNIASGVTYALYLADGHIFKKNYLVDLMKFYGIKTFQANTYIKIDGNAFSQNRYGIIAANCDNIQVTNNYFSQRFTDSATRKFWTDNRVLLRGVTHLVWTDNVYKEAFTQVNGGDNTLTKSLVPFPETGGVVLSGVGDG